MARGRPPKDQPKQFLPRGVPVRLSTKNGDVLTRRLRLASSNLVTTFSSVTAEFGAYMYYSRFLEEGTRLAAARPHIRPAIFNTLTRHLITKYVTAFLQNRLTVAMNTGTQTTPEDVEQMWVRVLNSKPRQHAVDSARLQKVYRFGFHIRSIRGYGRVRSVSEVKAEQEEAFRAIRQRLGARKKGSKPDKRAAP